jgi:type II secretory pathway pseudopilin PulG
MAALLVAMSIMGVMMGIVLPAWKQTVRREKEAELVFRGQQYVRAIRLFQQRSGPGVLPPSVDVLVEQRYLRQAFKDPIANDKFLVLPGVAPTMGSQTSIQFSTSTGANTSVGGALQARQDRLGGLTGRGGTQGSAGVAGAIEQPATGAVPGGISGVVSRSPAESILVYNGRTHYNEWEFRHIAPAQPSGGGGVGGAGGIDGRGGRGVDGRGGVGFDGRGGQGRANPRGGPGSPFIGDPNNIPRGGRGFELVPDGRGGVQAVPINSGQPPQRGVAPTAPQR